jgi:hypothetical protein
VAVPGEAEMSLEPIRNPVNGAENPAVVRLRTGFEVREEEVVSSDLSSQGELSQQHSKCYGFLTYAGYGPHGVIEEQCYPRAGA